MKSYLLIIIFFYSLNVAATAQIPDFLISGKDTLSIHSNPLDEYFKIKPIPKNLLTSFSSANWRGYIAYFKFINDELVVENIYKRISYKDNNENKIKLISIYKDVFGDTQNFKCTFFNGLLTCPFGNIVEYVHMGYASSYENYKLIEINNGLKIKEKDLTNEEFQIFKLDYFIYYKSTEEYKVEFEQYKEMMSNTNNSVDSVIDAIEDKPRKKKKENKQLKKKEAEFKMQKEIDNFIFLMIDKNIKTIDIPKNE